MVLKRSWLLYVAISVACWASVHSSRFGKGPIKVNVKDEDSPITIPRFKPEIELSDVRYKFDEKFIKKVKEEMLIVIHNAFNNDSFFKSITISRKLHTMYKNLRDLFEENKELKKNDQKSPELNSGLGETNGKMLSRMTQTKYTEEIEKNEAYRRIKVVLDAIEEITKLSNTGLVLEFPKMTIGDQKLEDYMGPAIQKLISTSSIFPPLIKGVVWLLKHTKKANGSDKDNAPPLLE